MCEFLNTVCQWKVCLLYPVSVTRAQSTRAPLGWGEMGDSQLSYLQYDAVIMVCQYGMFPSPCLINAIKN